MSFKKLLLLVFLFGSNMYGQEAHETEFDFFTGEWKIDQSILSEDGEWLHFKAVTRVEKQLNGKLLTENWEGEVQFYWERMEKPKNVRGFSLRYFDKNSNEWKIFWMDDLNPEFSEPFKGNFIAKNKGIFYKTSGRATSKIVFTVIDDNNILWELFISPDTESWRKIWVMEMQKAQQP